MRLNSGLAAGFLQNSKLLQVVRISDFRLLWLGAFVSFSGSWIQNVAQGNYVYTLTGSESMLATVSFANSLPVFFFGFLAGSMSDSFDKRTLLIITQILFAIGAGYLAYGTYTHTVAMPQILIVAFLTGLVGCVEMPARQSIVSKVVPPELLAAAVPVQAMTFNAARIIGPALGGLLLTRLGVASCYLVNAVSFIALIWSVLAIRSNLSGSRRERQPMKDIIFEGMLYTWREARLRTLLILETITAVFGIFYLPLVPAYVDQVLGLGTTSVVAKRALANSYVSVGIGAMISLLLITQLSESRHKGKIIRASMLALGFGLLGLSFTREPWVANIFMAITGGATIVQFNTTNALFQLLSPERLRGRVLSMHIWALNGLSPFGILFMGWISDRTRGASIPVLSGGVPLALRLGCAAMLVGCAFGFLNRKTLTDLNYPGSSSNIN